jgi:hypothetical protein
VEVRRAIFITMSMPIIIAIPLAVVFFLGVAMYHIIKEWWAFKQQPPRQVNESERPAIIKPKRFYKGKGL